MAKQPRQVIDDSLWKKRIPAANEYYDKWAKLFNCDLLERYYEGFQVQDPDPSDPPYIINKIYETIQIKQDSFMTEFPRFLVTPRQINSDFDLQNASRSAQLKEAVINTVITDPNVLFVDEIKEAYKDSFFRFGLIEVGYAADWIINPNVPKPLTNYDSEEYPNQKVKVKNQPEELPINERVFFKHIKAKNFRVGGLDHKYLDRCTWYGYKEWVHKADLLAIPGLMNREKLEDHVGMAEVTSETSDDKKREETRGEAVCIWHIWDNKAKVRVIVLDDAFVTIWQRGFKRQTIFDFRPDRRVQVEGFYPVPPVYHWISSQRELNECRNQLKNHRKRFTRKYQVVEGRIDEEEIEKFETGEDGSLVKVKIPEAILPIQNADLGIVGDKMLALSTDDLNQISGTSVNNRGEASRTTATESSIIEAKSTIREDAEKARIVRWLMHIGREALMTIGEKFTLGLWVRLTSDTEESLLEEMKADADTYKFVTSENIQDGYDFRIEVDVASLSSVSKDAEKTKLFEFLSAIQNFQFIVLSPKLIRETAYRIGYNNEAVIREMQHMALLQQLGTVAGINQAMPQGNAGQQIAANRTPPKQEQIRNQLTQQLRPN